MRQNMTAESRLNSSLRRFKTFLVHFRSYVTTISSVRIVHNMIVKRTVGNDNSMVSSKVSISATKVVIESGDSPSYTVDYPVVTDVKIIECTSLDCVVLGCGYGSTEVLTSVNRIVSTSVVKQ